MKIGITLDDWKLPVFRRRLAAAGYTYLDGGALMPNITLLTVETDDPAKLALVVKACNDDCQKQRGA